MYKRQVADVLCDFADQLEKAEDFTKALNKLIKKTIKEHKRIIFNGNNYSEEWVKEAEKRGLLNLPSTADALPYYISDANIKMFEKHGVLSSTELRSRCEITLENYCKQLHIEALTMLDMISRDILPSVFSYMKDLSSEILAKKQIGNICCEPEESTLKKLSDLSNQLHHQANGLKEALAKASDYGTAERCV